jgi:CHAD domain-containing protein
MRARRVEGLDPERPLRSNAARIVGTRLEELRGFAEEALDPVAATAQHDMRIAAKRLRYVCELTGPALGRAAATGAREAKEIQTLLGELHDCDVMLELIDEHAERLGKEDSGAALALAPRAANDLPADTVRSLPNRLHYRGLEALTAYFQARRDLLHRRFVEKWERLERNDFAEKLLTGIGA